MNPSIDDKGSHAMVRQALAKERVLHSFGIEGAAEHDGGAFRARIHMIPSFPIVPVVRLVAVYFVPYYNPISTGEQRRFIKHHQIERELQ